MLDQIILYGINDTPAKLSRRKMIPAYWESYRVIRALLPAGAIVLAAIPKEFLDFTHPASRKGRERRWKRQAN